MVQHPEESKFRLRDAFLLCLLLFVLYNLNFRLVRIDDSVPSRLLPFSLLLNHTFYLDGSTLIWRRPTARMGPTLCRNHKATGCQPIL